MSSEEIPAAAAAQPQQQDTEELDYTKKVQAIAEKGVYEFEYVEGPKAGEKVRVQRYKISNRMMLELERKRGEYTALVSTFADGVGRNKAITKEERFQAAEMLSSLYSKLAEYYFHIKKEEFELMDWDSSKPNLDAASNISIRGRPNLV